MKATKLFYFFILCIIINSCDLKLFTIETKSIVLNESALSMQIGNTHTISYKIIPENTNNKEVKWSSSNSTIATVSNNGLIIAKDIGTTTITVETLDNNKSDSCLVSVKAKSLSDSRFNGDFVYSYYWEDSNGIEETNEYTSFDFDGTNKVYYYSKYSKYRTASGWSYSGDYLGDYYSWYLEFEVNNNLYRERLWNNSYSDWSDWESYSFSNNNNTLTLKNYYNISGYDIILTKNASNKSLISSKGLSQNNLLQEYDKDKNKKLEIIKMK